MKARRRKRPYVSSAVKYQIGKSNRKADAKRRAMRPGKRISKSGNTYYETRKNRSDMRPFVTGL